jgi:ribosomal protein S18 acetylase RimI-like enzyme
MISKLNNKNKEVSENIYTVFQVSYKIESELLKAVDFPPLKRSVRNFTDSNTQFFGYYSNEKLAGVIEIKSDDKSTHIQSLVVHPNNFRQGIASKLMKFTLVNFNSKIITVETGLQNIPAINLYKQFEFIETKQWDTNHGIRKIELKLNR